MVMAYNTLWCWKCNKDFGFEEEMSGTLLEDSDDCKIWYCKDCSAKVEWKRTIISAPTVRKPCNDSHKHMLCQWCKEPLPDQMIMSKKSIVMHLNCYENLLDKVRWEV